jgi:beta-glucosidase
MLRKDISKFVFVAVALLATTVRGESTTEPANKMGEAWWKDRHEAVTKRVKEGNVGLIFVGDSITQGWEGAGREAWQKHFAKYNPVNLGFGGDRTQHVLWRLENGEIDGIQPKAAVIMIGTNNSNGNDNTAEEIGAGITAIVGKLREKLPDTKILVLAIFPRGEKPGEQREKNAKASEIASKLADNEHVFYMDIGPLFLNEDGTLSREIMPDLLHLNEKSYAVWAEAIAPKVDELMK